MSVEFLHIGSNLSLGDYIIALIDALGTANPAALARMRHLIGTRRARIILDREAVDIFFNLQELQVQIPSTEIAVNGTGETDTATVLALLSGHLEVADAILEGRLRVYGFPDDITAILVAIEILLDCSPRTETLQTLAAQFWRERGDPRNFPAPSTPRIPWYPFSSKASEVRMLAQFGLLPKESTRSPF